LAKRNDINVCYWDGVICRVSGYSDAFIEFVLHSCMVRPLSSVIEELGIVQIDLLKIDVEGDELLVLKGLGEQDWKKVCLTISCAPYD
jgi:FkbM family methyltransferase